MASFFRNNIDNFMSHLRNFDNFCRGNNHTPQPQPPPPPRSTPNQRPSDQQPSTVYCQPLPPYSATTTGENSRPRSTSSSNHNSRPSRGFFSGTARCQNTQHNHQNSNQQGSQQTTNTTLTGGQNQANSQQPSHIMNRNPPVINKNEKLDIGDILDPSDISRLSARELKTILTRNCIDYKGCIEKEELREKVMTLWIDFNERRATRMHNRAGQNSGLNTDRSVDSSDGIDDNQLCKICMEREIDCVLLECGHYLSCVTCGRKLAECPICRRNVTRCVRTFKG